MRKIILIQPKVGSWEFIQETPMVPLALLLTSAYVEQDHEVKIIDQRMDRDWAGTLRRELEGDVLCVGVTAFTGPQIVYGLEASRLVKQHSRVPVVWGGIHPSILPGQTVSHEAVDLVLVGEGEVAFRDLVQALETGAPPTSVAGVWALGDAGPVGSPPVTIREVNDLPRVPYHLVHLEDYISRDRDGRRKFPIKTSRGCPYRCTFCHQNSNYRKKWRSFHPSRVLDEMEMLNREYQIQHFQILDDNFFVDVKRAHEILRGMADRRIDAVLTINGSRVTDILRLSEESLQLLAGGRCAELQIGLESGSQHILNVMKKDLTLDQVLQANEKLKQHRIPRYYELVSGFPEETSEHLAETARFILQLSDNDPDVFFAPLESLTAYPGTEVYQQAEAAGMQFPQSLEGWGGFEWSNPILPWMDRKTRRMLKAFHIFPTLISSEIKVAESAWLKLLFRLYRPVARWRVRHQCFIFPLESTLFDLLAWRRSRRAGRAAGRDDRPLPPAPRVPDASLSAAG